MSVGYKRAFNDTMDDSNSSHVSLFSSINSNFKRRRASEAPQPLTGMQPKQSPPISLASRIANAISGKLQPGALLNPKSAESSASNSRNESRSNSMRSVRPSSLRTSFGGSFGNSLGASRDGSLRNSLSGSLRNSFADSSTFQKHGFAIIGSHTVGVNAHKPPQQSPDIMRLKMALLQDYRNKLAQREKLLTDGFDAESEKVVAERRRKLEEEQQQEEASQDAEDEVDPPLDADQQRAVSQYFAAARQKPRDVVVDAYKIELTFSDLATLQPGKWLNDNVIDLYMNTIAAHNPRVFVFTTHFFTRLEEAGYSAVRRWALRKKLDVFEPDQVFVPVNRGNLHWTLAVIDNKNKKLAFYDSLPSGRGQKELELLVTYLKEEAKRMGKPGIPDYELIPNARGPTQSNGSDCGVFVCEAVSRLARGHGLGHTQRDMPQIRMKIASNLIELQKGSRL